jgi:hypothetical protein
MEEEDFSTIEKKVLSVTDGFDAVPRPTGFDNSDEQIPPGHIVYQGDFEPPLDQA